MDCSARITPITRSSAATGTATTRAPPTSTSAIRFASALWWQHQPTSGPTQIANGHPRVGAWFGPTELGAHTCQQLGDLERLGDVVDSAGIEPDHYIEFFVASGEQHHIDGRVAPMNLAAHVEPIQIVAKR